VTAFLLTWLEAFVLTQGIEMPVHANAPGPARPWRERLAIAFGASAVTHPIVNFVIVPLAGPLEVDWWTMVAFAECFAFVTEALWLFAFRAPFGWACLTSLIANTLSFTVGVFCYFVPGMLFE